MKGLYESLLDDLDDLMDRTSEEVNSYGKIGKYYNIESSSNKNACITLFGDTKRILNMFDSKKLKKFNKTLYQFDLKSKQAFNGSSRKLVTDNKIELIVNAILNMDVNWVTDGKLDDYALKRYFSNFVKDGWEKYLYFHEYNSYRFDISISIHNGLIPNGRVEIDFKKK